MKTLKAIETEYRGYRFRSRLEARWAVFFDACGVKWEYEPEGYDLGDGLYYLPDFLLHGVEGRISGDLYVEVKGRMNDEDAGKMIRFAQLGADSNADFFDFKKYETATLVVGDIPPGNKMPEIINFIGWTSNYGKPDNKLWWPDLFSFELINGDPSPAFPGINKRGQFELFCNTHNGMPDMDPFATERAYRLARQARFEHGQTPYIRRAWK